MVVGEAKGKAHAAAAALPASNQTAVSELAEYATSSVHSLDCYVVYASNPGFSALSPAAGWIQISGCLHDL